MSSIVDIFNRMNLDAPGLEAVKAAVEAGDYPAAETAYLAYYRARKPPILDWHTEHRGGRSFETNSTGWNFLTAIPELITWRDREKLKGLISCEKGYTFSRTEGIKSSDYTVLDLADMLLENKVFIPYHPEDGVQDLGPRLELGACASCCWTAMDTESALPILSSRLGTSLLVDR